MTISNTHTSEIYNSNSLILISIIIPTLNEVDNLNKVIEHTRRMASSPQLLEIIVVDAGSKDGTLDSIDDSVTKYCEPDFVLRKYKSLNLGISKSSGDVVLFLDADTYLPKDFDICVLRALDRKNVVGGAFEFSFQRPDWKLKLLTLVNQVRYRIDRAYYGDQALFAKASTLKSIGGVPKEPLMEAAFLSKALRKEGKMALIRPGIVTSARRFNQHGFFKIFWFDLIMFIRFNLGLTVSSYAESYWNKNLNPE